jgi:ribosomal subunit interface protein
MDIRVKADFKMTADTRDYLEARLRPLEKHLGEKAENARCEVEITRAAGDKKSSDHMWRAEVHIIVPGEKSIYAKNHAASVNAAIDDVKEEIERQIRKIKKTSRAVRKKVGAKVKRMMRA